MSQNVSLFMKGVWFSFVTHGMEKYKLIMNSDKLLNIGCLMIAAYIPFLIKICLLIKYEICIKDILFY